MKFTWRYLLALAVLLSLFAACSSDADPAPTEEEPDPEESEPARPAPEDPASNFFKIIRVTNFAGDTVGSDPDKPGVVVYYSLEDNKSVKSSYAKTTRWDLAFGGLYNSFLSGNNGSGTQNHGNGNKATGGIYIVETPFQEVTEIPADNLFKTARDVYGTDDSGAFGTGVGWYAYDFGGSFGGDAHICYPIKERTLILRTARGDYAKVRMISIYKDAPDPYTITRWHPHPYFTFEYVLVPKGSARFDVKENE